MNRLCVRKERGFTLIELMIVVVLLGVLVAIAIPNFLKFQTRARQAEAKANLTAWYAAERAYYQEENQYTESVLDVGFSPERGNRYAYYFGYTPSCVTRTAAGESTVVQGNNCIAVDEGAYPGANPTPAHASVAIVTYAGPGPTPGMPGMRGCTGSNCHISGYAAGDIDNETVGIDTWWVSTKGVSAFAGQCNFTDISAAAGVPILVNDDVTCN